MQKRNNITYNSFGIIYKNIFKKNFRQFISIGNKLDADNDIPKLLEESKQEQDYKCDIVKDANSIFGGQCFLRDIKTIKYSSIPQNEQVEYVQTSHKDYLNFLRSIPMYTAQQKAFMHAPKVSSADAQLECIKPRNLVRDVEVAIFGRSNVGKSTIINRIRGIIPKRNPNIKNYIVASVSKTPGQTQTIDFYACRRSALETSSELYQIIAQASPLKVNYKDFRDINKMHMNSLKSAYLKCQNIPILFLVDLPGYGFVQSLNKKEAQNKLIDEYIQDRSPKKWELVDLPNERLDLEYELEEIIARQTILQQNNNNNKITQQKERFKLSDLNNKPNSFHFNNLIAQNHGSHLRLAIVLIDSEIGIKDIDKEFCDYLEINTIPYLICLTKQDKIKTKEHLLNIIKDIKDYLYPQDSNDNELIKSDGNINIDLLTKLSQENPENDVFISKSIDNKTTKTRNYCYPIIHFLSSIRGDGINELRRTILAITHLR